MADAGTENLGFKVEVEDRASGPLGKIEGAYARLGTEMDQFNKKLAKGMRTQNEAMSEEAESCSESQEATKDKAGRIGEMTNALRKNADSLEEVGVSWDKMIGVLEGITIGAIAAGVIGFLTNAVMKANEFRGEMLKLNEVMELSASQMREVNSVVLGFQGYAGKSREEVAGLARKLLELGQAPGTVEELGISFKQLAKDALDMSAATGISVDSSAELTDQLVRMNMVPANNIRNIAFSIKNVADQTRITADELIGFNKALEPLFAVLSDQTPEARARFTQEMMGIAGVLSNVGIDAGKTTDKFGEMLDRTSEEGAKSLGQLAQFTGVGTERLRDMIANDPTQVFDRLAKSAARMDTDQLQLMARSLEPLGMNFADLTRLANEYGAAGKKSFRDSVDEVIRLEAKDKALASAASRRQTRIDAMSARFGRMWDSFTIRVGGKILDKIIIPLSDRLIPVLEDVVDYIVDLGDEWSKINLSRELELLWQDVKKLFSDMDAEWIGFYTGVKNKLKMLGLGIHEFIALPFKLAIEGAMMNMDLMIMGMAKLANKLGPVANILIPGGEKIVKMLEEAGSAAEKRIEARQQEKREAPSTAALALSGGVAAMTGPGVNVPSRMTTTSPTQEALQRETNDLLRTMANDQRRRRATSPKASLVAANSGS